ncbi:Ig-like domain repeat protein [Methanosphaera sp.]|uniref:Ig-like domain repeat protein n=1 Tax=Methanosphaera sp. TaxID=2666342 RepID=UPI0026DEF385|nr:Ig-like domain repeat protein [Methanosphaera sp.]MDO5822395.1 Ig-like domain repeat protein [Methanosphaera sp.]
MHKNRIVCIFIMLLVLLIGLSCAVATDTSKDISELEVKKQDIDTNINALKESNVDKTVNQKEIIGTQNTQIDKIKAKETTKNTITKKEPTISSTEKLTKTTYDDTQEASNHDAKSNKKSTNLDNQKSNTDSSTLIPLEDHEEVSYDNNTVSNEVNINSKVTNNIKDSTFNLKNIEEPYKNVSSLNQINTNGTFNLTSDTSGQLTLSDGNTTIYGNNHKIIPNNPNQYFVTINAGQKLTLKNIVIDSNPGFFSDWLYRPAIIVNAGGELILDNCTISRTIQAIKSEGNVTILNSNINNNGRIAHGATIEIKGNSNVYIEKSRLSNNQYCGIYVASNQAKVLLNQTELSGSIEMHVYLGNISLYNVTYDGTQITDENKVSNNGIQDTQDKTNKKNIIILEDSMISIDHAQKILNSTTMTINGRLTSGNTYLPNQTLKVYVDDVLIGEVTTNDNGYYTISYTAEEVGNHNIKVTYDGNYKYLPSEAKSSFEVYKIDTNIIINNINDELFDKLANITGTLTNANDEVISNAKVIVTINGNQKILITNSTGGFTYTGAKVLLGDNTVTALFEGTRIYNPSEDTKTFTGKKHDTQITLNPIENTHIDDSIEISGILTDVNGTVLTNKNIIITIDNQQHTITTDDNGKYSITHTLTSSGEKTVLVTYDGDTAYNPSSNQTSFNVRKINTTISLDNISDTTIDSTIWISGILKDEFGNIIANKEIIITINGQKYTTTTNNDGKYNYIYTTSTLGENIVSVNYPGDNKYSPSSNQTSFNVRRINTNLSIDTIDDTTIGSDITISGILKDEFGNIIANKEIIITINGQEYTTTTDNDGKYNYKYTTEMTGLHNIEVIYAGDTTYFPSNNKTTFNVRKINTNLSINDINDTTIGQEIEISGVLTDEFGNTLPNTSIVIIINGQEYTTTTNNDGKYNYKYTTSTLDENIVNVNYPGDNKYSPSSNQTSFNVRRINTNLSIDTIDDTTIGSDITISGILKDEFGNIIANKEIIITINGQEYIINTNADGKYNYIYTTSTLGENIVSVNYPGDNKYSPSSNQTSFNVRRINTNLSIDTIDDTTIGSDITISGILKDEFGNIIANKEIIITINGQEYIINTNADGKYNYIYTTSTLGENIVSVNYPGDNKYSPSSNQTSFNVRRINTNLSIDTIDDTTIGSDITISGILKDEFGNIIANKEIIITINGQEYTTTTDNDGKYNYKYTTEMTGLHNIEVIYAGDTTYFPSNNKTTFNVRKINTNLSINDINDTTIGQEIEISGVLTDEFGNNIPNATIKIIVNGNQQNTTITDTEGNYKVIIKNTLGLNTVFVIYDGNYKYYSSNNQTSFNTTTNTMISINNIDDTTIGSSININGTLKDGEGNTLSNTNLIITINGQKYTVITDNDGKYNYIYTTITLGENIVEVAFTGNTTHKPSNNQTSFNVRKINTNLSIDIIDDTTIESDITISGVLTDEFGNTLPNTSIVIIINGQEYTTTTDNDGKYNYKYTTITLYENIVSVNYPGNNKYSSSSNQTSFNVRKINTNLSINDVNDTTIGSDITISGVLTDEFGNKLINTSIVIIINGQEYTTTTDDDGKYNYIYTTSTLGENIINVNYLGNNKYSPSSNQTSFNVRKINTNLSIDTIDDTTVGRDITVSGVLTDEFGNILANTNITIIVNGNIFKATTDVNGVYNYGYTIDVTELHRVDVIYSGNTTHFSSNNNTSFNVRKIDTNLSINTINDTTISSNVEVSGTLTDEYENILPNTTITININGQEYTTTTDNDGKYNYTYMVNTLDQNTVIVNYPGDDKYNSATTFTTFNARKINTKLFINTINDTTVGQDINVGGVLKDEFENILVNTTVEITITNPKGTKNTYTTTTNEEGMYSVTYAGNIDGTYKVEVNYIGNNTYNSSSNETSFNTRKINTKLIIDSIENTTIDTNIFITGKLVDEFGNIVPNTFINITVNNNMIELYVDANGTFTYIYKTSILGENNITLQYNGNDTYNPSSNEASFNVRKLKSTIVVDSIVGYIGENITLTARITDENGKLVNGGNIVFKFNGKTLREDGRFDSTASPMKFKVVDGIVKYITVADAYLRNVKHITATYSGSYNYESSKAEYNHVLLNKRSAQISVTVTPNFTKQNTKIVFNATIKDVTINGTNTSIINNNGKVIFKINGKVVKDEDGNIIFVKVVNNSANYTYYIPNGMASVYNNSVLRNYTVEAVYGNPLYDSDTRNTTIFNVEQSPININVANITINKNTNKLTLKANITDYQENLVVGTNKICLKINDKTLTDESNNTIYYYITDGIIDLSNITVPAINNYHNITIVAGERYAYKSNKITSTDINVVDK